MNHYEVLGVGKSATKDEINKAARKLKQKFHPDRAGGDEKKFKDVGTAQRLLTDDSKRKRYDETGSTEDAPQEMTDEMHAISILGKIFIAVLDKSQEGNPFELDPIAAVTAEVVKGMAEGPKMIAAHKFKIAKAEKAVKKLKQKVGKPGYLQNALTTHIAGLKAMLVQMELAQRIGPLMLEILKDYSWEQDRRNVYGGILSGLSYPPNYSTLGSLGE